MTRRIVAPLVLAALAAPLVLAGCGDGGDSESPAPSESAHIDRANAICRDGLKQARRLGRTALQRLDTGADLDVVTEAFVKPGIPLLERQAERLRRVEAEADDPRLTAYVELYDPVIELSRQRVEAARAGDGTRASELTEYAEQLGADGQLAAREAGLVDCDLDFQRAVVESSAGK